MKAVLNPSAVTTSGVTVRRTEVASSEGPWRSGILTPCRPQPVARTTSASGAAVQSLPAPSVLLSFRVISSSLLLTRRFPFEGSPLTALLTTARRGRTRGLRVGEVREIDLQPGRDGVRGLAGGRARVQRHLGEHGDDEGAPAAHEVGE